MFQKLSLGSVTAFVLLFSTLVLSSTLLAKHSLAKVIENVRKVTSYQARVRIESQLEEGKPAIEQTSLIYWKASGAFRMESAVKMPGRKLVSENVTIRFQDHAGIELNVPNKTFRRVPAAAGSNSPLMALEKLAKLRGNSAEDLGVRRIGEVECYGFEMPMVEVDENVLDGSMEIWVDKKTDLPIEIRMEVLPGVSMVTSEIEWNKEFENRLFSATPPGDFTEDLSRGQPASDEEIARQIIAALDLYSRHSGGEYPQVKVIYGDVVAAQLRKLAGFGNPPYSKKVLSSESFAELANGTSGFAHMTTLMRDTADAAYFGKNVGPTEKKEVLFRWKRADGKLQVIYGDLRTAIVY